MSKDTPRMRCYHTEGRYSSLSLIVATVCLIYVLGTRASYEGIAKCLEAFTFIRSQHYKSVESWEIRGIVPDCFATQGGNIMSMFSTIKEIYLGSKINSTIYPHLKCIICYMNDSHLSIFARVARQKFSSSGTMLAR